MHGDTNEHLAASRQHLQMTADEVRWAMPIAERMLDDDIPPDARD